MDMSREDRAKESENRKVLTQANIFKGNVETRMNVRATD